MKQENGLSRRIVRAALPALILAASASPVFAQAPVVAALTDAQGTNIVTEINPGGLGRLFGENLTLLQMDCQAPSFERCGVSTTVQGKPAEMLRAAANEILLQFPADLELGEAAIVVTVEDQGSSEPLTVTVVRFAPVLFSDASTGIGSFTRAGDSSPVTADEPAVEGNTLTAFATGLGATQMDEAGFERLVAQARVLLRQRPPDTPAQEAPEIDAQILFAVSNPSFLGLYEIVFTVPCGLRPATYEMVVELTDADSSEVVRSAAVLLPVGQAPLTISAIQNAASFAAGKPRRKRS